MPYPPGGDAGGLDALLNAAGESFRTVYVVYRTWRHDQRLREVLRARTGNQKRRGVSTGSAETEETVRVWREGRRARQEHHGGPRDGSYAVADGPLWWSWNEQMGARSNQDDPRRQSVSISQVAAADAARHYGNIIDDRSWQEAPRGDVDQD